MDQQNTGTNQPLNANNLNPQNNSQPTQTVNTMPVVEGEPAQVAQTVTTIPALEENSNPSVQTAQTTTVIPPVETKTIPTIQTPQTNVQNTSTPVKAKNKGGVGCCIIGLVVLFVGIIAIAVLGYFGYRSLSKTLEAVDLGVTYTSADYDQIKSDLQLEVDDDRLCINCTGLYFSEPVEASLKITNSQATAFVNKYMSYVEEY